MIAATNPKALSTIRATLALEGIVVEPSRDEAGRRTVIVTRGAYTREVPIERLHEALAEVRALRQEVATV